MPIGVDIGAGSVKLLQLRRAGGKLTVVNGARVDFDPQTVGAPPMEKLDAIAEGVRAKLNAGGFVGSSCVVSIDDELLRIRSVRQPKMPLEEAESALRLDAPDRLGFAPEDGVEIGWLRAGEVRHGEDIRDELILVGAFSEQVDQLVDAVVRGGLRPIAVEPGFLACARSLSRTFRRASDSDTVRLVVEIGYRSAGVIVLRGSDVVFYKAIQIGGSQFDALVAEHLEMDLPAAVELRRTRIRATAMSAGSPVDGRVDRAVFAAVRPVLDQLASEVALCLRYYTVTFRGQRPIAALLVGGDAGEPGLVDVMSGALNVPTEIARPLDGVDLRDAGAMFDRRSGNLPGWCVATGLSLQGDLPGRRRPLVGRRTVDAEVSEATAESGQEARSVA